MECVPLTGNIACVYETGKGHVNPRRRRLHQSSAWVGFKPQSFVRQADAFNTDWANSTSSISRPIQTFSLILLLSSSFFLPPTWQPISRSDMNMLAISGASSPSIAIDTSYTSVWPWTSNVNCSHACISWIPFQLIAHSKTNNSSAKNLICK